MIFLKCSEVPKRVDCNYKNFLKTLSFVPWTFQKILLYQQLIKKLSSVTENFLKIIVFCTINLQKNYFLYHELFKFHFLNHELFKKKSSVSRTLKKIFFCIMNFLKKILFCTMNTSKNLSFVPWAFKKFIFCTMNFSKKKKDTQKFSRKSR